MELINKAAVVAEIERSLKELAEITKLSYETGLVDAYMIMRAFLETLEVKDVNIAEMADEYYDALMKESDWMDVDTMGHCRLAYYNGCKDVLNKIQKRE